MTAQDIVKLLAIKYSAPDFAFLTQVRSGTGGNYSRTADAIALGLWPSRGIYLNGFEIKVSRWDLINELKSPEKADAIGQFCHFWWLVIPDELFKPDKVLDLPETWGLMTTTGNSLRVVKKPRLMKPKPITWEALAGIFRKIADSMVPIETVTAKVDARVKSAISSHELNAKYRVENCEKIEKKVREFEERSGIKIDQYEWNLGNIADAVRMIRESKSENYFSKLLDIKKAAQNIVDNLTLQLGKLND